MKAKVENTCGDCDHFAQSAAEKRLHRKSGQCHCGRADSYFGDWIDTDMAAECWTPIGGLKRRKP